MARAESLPSPRLQGWKVKQSRCRKCLFLNAKAWTRTERLLAGSVPRACDPGLLNGSRFTECSCRDRSSRRFKRNVSNSLLCFSGLSFPDVYALSDHIALVRCEAGSSERATG